MTHTYALVTVLCSSAYTPPAKILQMYGEQEAIAYCYTILVMSTLVFPFTFWCLKSKWGTERPARMPMLCLASVVGLMTSVSALFAINRIWPEAIYFWWTGIPSFCLIGAVLLLAFIDLTFFGKKKVS